MHKRRFVTRTIKNGQVKIYGKMYKPTSRWLEYDGRLDGMRCTFGLYWVDDEPPKSVALWGTEEAFQAAVDESQWREYRKTHPHSPEAVYNEKAQNWYYPWATWYTESIKHKEIKCL